MNKLNTVLYGGFPYDLNDWRWQLDAMLDGLKGLGSAIGPNCILTGCDYTMLGDSTVGYCNSGWLLIDGELCYWPGGNGVGYVPLTTFFTVAQTLDPSGEETFEDGTTQNAYIKRVAQLVGGSIPGVPYTRIIGPNMRRSLIGQEDWLTVGSTGNAPFQTAWTHPGATGYNPAYRKEFGSLLRLRGVVNRGVGSTDEVPFVLPVGYRPAASVFASLPSIANPSIEHCSVEISNNGSIYIHNAGLTGNDATYDLAMLPVFETA